MNADGELTVSKNLMANLYMYCNNNPVMLSDIEGNLARYTVVSDGGSRAYYHRTTIDRSKKSPSAYKYAWWDFYRSRFVVSGAINLALAVVLGGTTKLLTDMLERKIKFWGEKAVSKYLIDGLKRECAKFALRAKFVNKIIKYVGVFVTVVTAFFSPGEWFFDYIDARDKKPYSGYWDF